MKCGVCSVDVDPKTAVRFAGVDLCPQHSDLALHGARKVTDLCAELGVTPEKQAAIADAGAGLYGLYRTFFPAPQLPAKGK